MAPHTNQGGIRQSDASSLLRVAGCVGDSIVDGPGLRYAIFCQGCPHACEGCHNPDTHPFAGGEMVSAEVLYKRIKGFPLCRGVTFSGGEPFCQPEPFYQLAKLLKPEGYELAAYTGFTFEELTAGTQAQKNLLGALDILIDGQFEISQRDLSLRFRGSGNQRILRVQESLEKGEPVWETNPRWVGSGE